MRRFLLWGVIVFVLVLGSIGTRQVLYRAERLTEAKARESRKPARTLGFSVVVLEAEERVAEIEAEEGTEDPKTSFSYFTGIREARFFDKGEEVAHIVRTKDAKGTYNRLAGLLDVKGEVVIQTRGKYRLSTRRLIYNKALKVMVCPQGVTLSDGKGAHFSAQYAIFLPTTESAMMLGRVRGTLTRKTTITLAGDFLRHGHGSPWTDLYAGANAEMQMPQTNYYTSLLPGDLRPTLKPGKASLSVKGYRMEGDYIQIDRDASRVSLINGGVVTVGQGNRVETSGYNPRTHSVAQLDYYWDRGYLFGKGNIRFSGQNGETGEADEVTYITGDRIFQFAGNVRLQKPNAGWLYLNEQASEGVLQADAVSVSEDAKQVNAAGNVSISEGRRLLEGSLVKAFPEEGRLYAERGRLVTEEQELTAKVIEITDSSGTAQGQVRLVRRSEGLDASATRLRWSGTQRVELEGTVTGTRGTDRFSAAQVNLTGSVVSLVGRAELRRDDRSVEAQEITAEGDRIVAEKGAVVTTDQLSISARSIQLNAKTESGIAYEVREILVTGSFGDAKGPVRLVGKNARFGWNPLSLKMDGAVTIDADSFSVEGQELDWLSDQGTVRQFTLRRKSGILGTSESILTGEQLRIQGKSFEATGSVLWREGNLELVGDQFSQDAQGDVRVTGQPTLRIASPRATVSIKSDELSLARERYRILFQGNVLVTRGATQAKSNSAYVLLQDQVFVMEDQVEVQRPGGDTLGANRLIIEFVSGKITMEDATGKVHY
ncbi:MAG: LptA/OstA family protein [bacterium JZ-2024 1]